MEDSVCAITFHLPPDYNNGSKCCQFWFSAARQSWKCLLALSLGIKYLYAAYEVRDGIKITLERLKRAMMVQ